MGWYYYVFMVLLVVGIVSVIWSLLQDWSA